MKLDLNLLDNGLDFIYESLRPAWIVSHEMDYPSTWKYSVLNFFSGVELLLKEKLRQEHWSLIFEDVSSATELKLLQGDFISVNHGEVIKRLKGICNISINDEPLNRLRKLRNRFEHYEAKISISECKEVIAEALHVVIDFWNSHILPICNEKQNEKFNQIINIVEGFDTYVEKAIQKNSKAIEGIVNSKAGIKIPCNKCGNETLIIFKDENRNTKCFVCDNSSSKADYIKDIRKREDFSGGLIPKDEYDTECKECNNSTRIKFRSGHSIEEDIPDYYYCVNCFHYDKDLTINERVEIEWSEKMKELEKNHSPDEIIEILKKELKNHEEE